MSPALAYVGRLQQQARWYQPCLRWCAHMRSPLSPKLQISLGLLSLTMSLVFIAASLGLLPNEERTELRMRATLSGAVAAQLATLASRNDPAAINDTIGAVIGPHSDIVSIGMRGTDGRLLASSPQHAAAWREQPDGKSTATHVQVPLSSGDRPSGRVEIVFRPLTTGGDILGLSYGLLALVAFLGSAAFVGTYFILGRAMRELDPARAVPDRVKTAFDTLTEGILILDAEERVLLANDALSEKILGNAALDVGSSVSELPWLSSASNPLDPRDLPWRVAMRTARPVIGIPMAIRSRGNELQRLIVNATCIVDADGATRGVIVTFADVTALHRTNEQLSHSVHQLHLSQLQISEQNKRLQLLASSDPLTGCLNRRTFFELAEKLLAGSMAYGRPMTFMMVDADHFKRINDRFGHLVGDKVLVGLSELLMELCPSPHLVGRYGGEEFCIALAGLSDREVEVMAERIRRAVSDVKTWLPQDERTTVSIGIAALDNEGCSLEELVKRADEALYAAKSGGRNRFVTWKRIVKAAMRAAEEEARNAIDQHERAAGW